jgi:hypothetical protein
MMVQFTANADQCSFVATCNGFPVFRADADSSWLGSSALNPYLVGKGNRLVVKFTGKGANARFSASVKEMNPGDIVDTLEEGDLKLPQGDTLEHVFDSSDGTFKGVLDQAKPSDAKTMIDFAMKFRDIVRAGDMAALTALNRIRINDIAAALGMPAEQIEPQLVGFMQAFQEGGADFEAGDVEAVAWCDNKLWELRRKDGHPLLYKKEEDGSMQAETFAATMPGGIQIVR